MVSGVEKYVFAIHLTFAVASTLLLIPSHLRARLLRACLARWTTLPTAFIHATVRIANSADVVILLRDDSKDPI